MIDKHMTIDANTLIVPLISEFRMQFSSKMETKQRKIDACFTQKKYYMKNVILQILNTNSINISFQLVCFTLHSFYFLLQ